MTLLMVDCGCLSSWFCCPWSARVTAIESSFAARLVSASSQHAAQVQQIEAIADDISAQRNGLLKKTQTLQKDIG